MNATELREKITNLSIWKKGDQRAPHKPLFILYALGRLQNEIRELPYEEVRGPLSHLLQEFGPRRKSYHPEHPFVRLVNDGIWTLNYSVHTKDISDRFLLNNGIVGGFSDAVFSLLLEHAYLISEFAELILNGIKQAAQIKNRMEWIIKTIDHNASMRSSIYKFPISNKEPNVCDSDSVCMKKEQIPSH